MYSLYELCVGPSQRAYAVINSPDDNKVPCQYKSVSAQMMVGIIKFEGQF